ncbi:MAG: T9SS type A sorting domain-containing protein [Sodaliphilus sp.]
MVYSTSGALVSSRNDIGDSATIDLSNLAPGYYVINVNGMVSKCVIVK